MKKKYAIVIVMTLLAVLLVSGCGRLTGKLNIDGQTVEVEELLRINDTTYTLSDYLYYYVQLKYEYDGNDDRTWERHPEWMTELKENALLVLQYAQARRELAADLGIKLNHADKKSIRNSIKETKSNYETNQEFEAAMTQSYMDMHIYTALLEDEIYNTKLYDYFYGDAGTEKISDEEICSYIMDNYVHYKTIYMRLDLDGTTTFQDSMQSISEQLKEGADFEELMNQYSRDTMHTDYPDGYYSKKTANVDFMEMLIAMEDNEISDVFESENGYYIFLKLPNDEAYIQEHIAEFAETYYKDRLSEKINAYVEKQEVEILSDYYYQITVDTIQ